MGAVKPRAACARTAVLAMLLVLAWSGMRVHYLDGGNWTALFFSGTAFALPPELAATTYRVPGAGYDGQFYRLLAHDPLFEKDYAHYVDGPQYRFRRGLVPIAAWLLALGRQPWIDDAYIALEMTFVALGTYWCCRLAVRRGRSRWWGLLFVVAPATLASFDRMLVDGPLAALFAGFLLYCEEESWGRVWLLAALAGLTRETGLLMAAALVADRAYRRDWRGAARFAACAVPALAWYAWLALRFPHGSSLTEIGIPAWPLLQRLVVFRTYPKPLGQAILRISDTLALLGLIACVTLAAVWLRKQRPGPVAICVALFACLSLVLGAPVLTEPYAFGRVVSPLLLWIMFEAVARKQWAALAPPLCISLGIGIFFASPLLAIGRIVLGH